MPGLLPATDPDPGPGPSLIGVAVIAPALLARRNERKDIEKNNILMDHLRSMVHDFSSNPLGTENGGYLRTPPRPDLPVFDLPGTALPLKMPIFLIDFRAPL